MKTLRYAICDVFTEQPLTGNPLAVFTDARGLDDATMQALARELNLSETTFVFPPERGGHAKVRIFTPQRELPFAGHPTLGTAFVLGGPLESVELRLELAAGVVPVRLEREGARIAFGWMTQPAARPRAVTNEAAILDALALGEPPLAVFGYENGPEHSYVELASDAAISALAPNFAAIARATPGSVFVYRFDGRRCSARCFVPGSGVPEDPATGSAVGPLALHLSQQGRLPAGDVLCVEQGRELGRPSTLYARIGAGTPPSIEVGGSARVVARGQFVI
ncbi:MAG TPA: PhzF family phenazine biosynthesis protein [Polyangiaceae bacterium]|nr:PhzF family phenazine biosynthesis protein [Polyangiaceae bacterium]